MNNNFIIKFLGFGALGIAALLVISAIASCVCLGIIAHLNKRKNKRKNLLLDECRNVTIKKLKIACEKAHPIALKLYKQMNYIAANLLCDITATNCDRESHIRHIRLANLCSVLSCDILYPLTFVESQILHKTHIEWLQSRIERHQAKDATMRHQYISLAEDLYDRLSQKTPLSENPISLHTLTMLLDDFKKYSLEIKSLLTNLAAATNGEFYGPGREDGPTQEKLCNHLIKKLENGIAGLRFIVVVIHYLFIDIYKQHETPGYHYHPTSPEPSPPTCLEPNCPPPPYYVFASELIRGPMKPSAITV